MFPAALTFTCENCGRAAAHFQLTPGNPHSATKLGQSHSLARTLFMGGPTTKYGPWEELEALFNALERYDFAAARRLDVDLGAFYCYACGKVYCDQCWSHQRTEFDEGFYDCTYATCPAGHEQMIDD